MRSACLRAGRAYFGIGDPGKEKAATRRPSFGSERAMDAIRDCAAQACGREKLRSITILPDVEWFVDAAHASSARCYRGRVCGGLRIAHRRPILLCCVADQPLTLPHQPSGAAIDNIGGAQPRRQRIGTRRRRIPFPRVADHAVVGVVVGSARRAETCPA